jgi:hypothetical protein
VIWTVRTIFGVRARELEEEGANVSKERERESKQAEEEQRSE